MDNIKPNQTVNELIAEKLGSAVSSVVDQIKEEINASLSKVEHIDVELTEEEIKSLHSSLTSDSDELKDVPVVAPCDLSNLVDAVRAVENGKSQVEVLTPLLEHAADFADRVAIFILKQDKAVGWKAKGFTATSDFTDDKIKSVQVPLSEDNVFSVVKNGPSVYIGDASKLAGNAVFTSLFGEPGLVAAIPLVTKNKITAILYADNGLSQGKLEIEKLEILLRIAGMAVDLINVRPKEVLEVSFVNEVTEKEVPAPVAEDIPEEPVEEEPVSDDEFAVADEPEEIEMAEEVEVVEEAEEIEVEEIEEVEIEEVADESEEVEVVEDEFSGTVEAEEEIVEEIEEIEEVEEIEVEPEMEVQEITGDETTEIVMEPAEETDEFDIVENEPVFELDNGGDVSVDETEEIPVAGIHDEPQDENTEAKRFARLLVSEILLYNDSKLPAAQKKKKVYAMLKEDIDRSFEMYKQRITPEVAKQHSFFYDELVKTLAGGDESTLEGYPFKGEG